MRKACPEKGSQWIREGQTAKRSSGLFSYFDM
jgi:hypothetical protein